MRVSNVKNEKQVGEGIDFIQTIAVGRVPQIWRSEYLGSGFV